MKNLEKTIKEAITSNKCKIGTRQVMGSIKGSKLIVLSNSLMPKKQVKNPGRSKIRTNTNVTF
jgi:ribosomal protein L30E